MVFGRVLEGMDVVYKVEAEGSQSGKPKSKVIIADSGEGQATPSHCTCSSLHTNCGLHLQLVAARAGSCAWHRGGLHLRRGQGAASRWVRCSLRLTVSGCPCFPPRTGELPVDPVETAEA